MQDRIAKYARLGLIAGTALGVFSGLVISGPQLHSWSPAFVLSVVVGATALGAILGYFAVALVVGSLIKGPPGELDESGMGNGVDGSGTGDGLLHDLNSVAHEHHYDAGHYGDTGQTFGD